MCYSIMRLYAPVEAHSPIERIKGVEAHFPELRASNQMDSYRRAWCRTREILVDGVEQRCSDSVRLALVERDMVDNK